MLLGVEILAVGAHHDQQRPLGPLRVVAADHRRLGDLRVIRGDVLDIDGEIHSPPDLITSLVRSVIAM
jgi:hypothetical protein